MKNSDNSTCCGDVTYVSSISVKSWTTKLPVGDTCFVRAIPNPDEATNKKVVWSSSNNAIATVNPDSGLVTAQSVGTVVITATAVDRGIVTGTYVIEVVPYIYVQSLTILNPELTMKAGEHKEIYKTITPANATKSLVKWSSSNECVATVDPFGFVKANKPGEVIITARTTDGTNLSATCKVIVEPILVESIDLKYTNLRMGIGQYSYLDPKVLPEDSTNKNIIWTSSDNNIATVQDGIVTIKYFGTVIITATASDGSGAKANCTITIAADKYTYQLVELFGFTPEEAVLIRSLYDRIDAFCSCKTMLNRAWMCSRLLSAFVYKSEKFDLINKFETVAGEVVTEYAEEKFFTNVLEYTCSEYDIIKSAIKRQHEKSQFPDFAHMQYSLAARLIYRLSEVETLPNNFIVTGEDISYLAGWLGDAVLHSETSTPTLKNDDYCADLDAENIYRLIIQEKTSVQAINEYYLSLTPNSTRADKFLSHINYSVIQEKIYFYLLLSNNATPMTVIGEKYPDTYNFMRSLQDGLANIAEY